MRRLCTSFLLVLIWWPAAPAAAQPQHLRFERLNVEDGLSQGTVFSMMQDRRGFMWFGTDHGLNRFDGYTFEVFASVPFDTTSLMPEAIADIDEAMDGALWIAGMYHGISRFDPSTGKAIHYRHDPRDRASLPRGPYNAVLEATDGTVWIGSERGLSRMDPDAPGRFVRYTHDSTDSTSLGANSIRFLFEDAAGFLWISTSDGLDRMDPDVPGRFSTYLKDSGGARGIHEDPRVPGVLWVGSGSGLVRIDTDTGELARYGQNSVIGVAPDPTDPGVLWAAVPDVGLVYFDMATGVSTSYENDRIDPNSLAENEPLNILTDRSGIVWIGHAERGGISRFNPAAGAFQVYLHDPGARAGISVWSIHEDSSGHLWTGSITGGVRSLQRVDGVSGEVTRWPTDGIIYDIVEDASGNIWLGTSRGLKRYDTGANRIADGVDRSDERVFDLHLGRDGAIWAATAPVGGVDRIDPATGVITRFINSSSSGFLTVYEDQAGFIWAGSNGGGIVRLDPVTARFTRYRHDPADHTSIAAGYVYGFVERAVEPGILWIAMFPGGLNRLDMRTGLFERFTTKEGLPDNSILALQEDDQGMLWMSTPRGLARFDPETGDSRSFGLEHGLQGLEFHAWSSAKGPNGRLFFGGVNGMTAFDPARISLSLTPPQVTLTGFRISNRPGVPGAVSPLHTAPLGAEEIRLRHDENDIDLDFVALHYHHPARNRYAYRLDGFDRDWIDSGSERTARYTNLPPGRFTFRVRAANADGVWNEEGASIALTVLPPWWRTRWAYGLYVVILIGGLILTDSVQRRRVLEAERRRTADRESRLRAELAEEQTRYLEELDEARNRFFANVSHEFRTPLTLLLGPLQAVVDRTTSTERLIQQVPMMHRNAGRLLRLVNQLLDLTRLEAGGMELHLSRIDLVVFVRGLVQAFASLAERDGLTLIFDTPEKSFPVAVDADKLEKILSNLLSNAVKFTMRGGKIRVGLTADGDGSGFCLTVSDTGHGITADELPHVFDRFYQVDHPASRRFEGTGIGLALVRELVELHDGAIAVESNRGFGTTFTVHMPRRTGVAAPLRDDGAYSVAELEMASMPAVVSVPDVRVSASARSVIVVDDNDDVRTFVRGILEADYTVFEAADGLAGLHLVREHLPDLIISDVMMPGLDGFALCRAVKSDEALCHIPVILLTAKAEEADRIYGLEKGADDYVTKPFNARELEVRVANLILSRDRMRDRPGSVLHLPDADVVIPPGEEAFLQQVLDVMGRYMGDSSYSTDRLADELNLSRRQVERKVKALTNHTPPYLMQRMRLEQAARILKERPGSIAEVAYAVGFKSPAHFSVIFRREFGHTPSEHFDDLP